MSRFYSNLNGHDGRPHLEGNFCPIGLSASNSTDLLDRASIRTVTCLKLSLAMQTLPTQLKVMGTGELGSLVAKAQILPFDIFFSSILPSFQKIFIAHQKLEQSSTYFASF